MVVVRSLACVLPRAVHRFVLTVASTALMLAGTSGAAAPVAAQQDSMDTSGTVTSSGLCSPDTQSCTAAPASGQAAPDTSGASLAADPLFAGLTLADSQRVAIAVVRARFMAEARVELDSLRDAMSTLQRPGTGDAAATITATTLAASLRSQLASLLTAERSAMRDLLTSAQQQSYDANVAADVARAEGADR